MDTPRVLWRSLLHLVVVIVVVLCHAAVFLNLPLSHVGPSCRPVFSPVHSFARSRPRNPRTGGATGMPNVELCVCA